MSVFSPDYILASVHLIKQKIEKLVFVVNIITTIFFLVFYGYMMYSRINESIANTIIYSLMGAILIVSLIFDVIFYKNNRIDLNFLEKRKVASDKKKKKIIVTVVKMIVKVASLGYATYELIAVDGSTIKIITLILSYLLFAMQIIIYLVATAIYNYYNYLYIGISKDIDELTPILHPIVGVEMQEANRQLMSKRDKEILKEIQVQRDLDEKISKINKNIKVNIANSGKKDKKKRGIRDAIETGSGIAPASKAYRFFHSLRIKKNKKE